MRPGDVKNVRSVGAEPSFFFLCAEGKKGDHKGANDWRVFF